MTRKGPLNPPVTSMDMIHRNPVKSMSKVQRRRKKRRTGDILPFCRVPDTRSSARWGHWVHCKYRVHSVNKLPFCRVPETRSFASWGVIEYINAVHTLPYCRAPDTRSSASWGVIDIKYINYVHTLPFCRVPDTKSSAKGRSLSTYCTYRTGTVLYTNILLDQHKGGHWVQAYRPQIFYYGRTF